MNFCTNCGQRVKPNTNYCPNCGINLNEIKPSFSEPVKPAAPDEPVKPAAPEIQIEAVASTVAEEPAFSVISAVDEVPVDPVKESINEVDSIDAAESVEVVETVETVENVEDENEAETTETIAVTETVASEADAVPNAEKEERLKRVRLINDNIDATGNAGASFCFISAAILLTLYIICTIYRSAAAFLQLPGGFVSPYFKAVDFFAGTSIRSLLSINMTAYTLVFFVAKLLYMIPILIFAIGLYTVIGNSDERPVSRTGFKLMRFDLILKLVVSVMIGVLTLAAYCQIFVEILSSKPSYEISFEGLPFVINPVYADTFILISAAVMILIEVLTICYFAKASGTFKIAMIAGSTGTVKKNKVSIYAGVICILIALLKFYSVTFNAVNFTGQIGHILLMVEYSLSALFYICMGLSAFSYRGKLKETEN